MKTAKEIAELYCSKNDAVAGYCIAEAIVAEAERVAAGVTAIEFGPIIQSRKALRSAEVQLREIGYAVQWISMGKANWGFRVSWGRHVP